MYADLVRLLYCREVFKETMHIYHYAYFFFRRAIRDVGISGYYVPKNVVTMVFPISCIGAKSIIQIQCALTPNVSVQNEKSTFSAMRICPLG
jgi:hypothetical protein